MLVDKYQDSKRMVKCWRIDKNDFKCKFTTVQIVSQRFCANLLMFSQTTPPNPQRPLQKVKPQKMSPLNMCKNLAIQSKQQTFQ